MMRNPDILLENICFCETGNVSVPAKNGQIHDFAEWSEPLRLIVSRSLARAYG